MKSIGIFWKKNQEEKSKAKHVSTNKRDNLANHETTPSDSVEAFTQEDEAFDLQINLWNTELEELNKDKSIRLFALDLGLVCPLSTKEIAFLLPFEVRAEDFRDLASVLANNDDLLCTVFNESLKKTTQSGQSYNVIESDRFKYVMYNLDKENIEKVSYDKDKNVSILSIKINSDFETKEYQGCRLFIRFRLKLKDLSVFAHKRKVSNDWLQSAFSSTYMFDIRINDVRELSDKKREIVINENHFVMPTFNKVHFYYMADSEETVENGSSMMTDSRLLENERWHSYLGEGMVFASENIAHHWKKKIPTKISLKHIETQDPTKASLSLEPNRQTFDDFTLFFKTEFSDINKKRISFYIFIVFLIGAISSSVVSTLIEAGGWVFGNGPAWETTATGLVATLLFFGILYYCLNKKSN